MKTTLTIILTLYSCLLCAQPSDMDIMFEGYEDSRLYDNWEYVLYHKTQSKACEEASLPPSVYLKLWDKDRGTVANPIDSSYVNLYWICPREFTEESRTLWKKMAKKWGIRKLSLYMKEDRKDSVVNFTLDAIPAKWMYNDTLVASHDVKHYGDSWVAEPNAALVIAPHNGKMRESSCNGLVEDRSRLLSDCDMIINTIHTKLTTLRWKTELDDPKEDTQILNLFARDITRFMPENAPKDVERKYNITLLIDSIGRSHLYQYHDLVKDSVDSMLLAGLDASIEANHYDTFRRMLTIEGDIFPWRYIRASYIKGKWFFMDYIWTEEEKRKYYMLRGDLNPMVQTCIETNWKLNVAWSFDELGKQWARYEKEEIDNNLFKVSHRYFTEAVSVKEMREAFYKYKDQQFMKSPYEGFDSIHSLYADAGESVMLLSPLKSHPRKEIRGCRVIWESSGLPKQIIDNSGKERADLLEKLKSSRKDWLNGDYLALREPRWYMGFAVSPVVYLDTFDNENYVRAPFASSPDFFSYASNHLVLDGEWYHEVGEGARRIGQLHAQNTSKHDGVQEKSFSVLLFTKAEQNSPLVSYSLELLEPESPDDVTKRLFEDFKHFVERIPSKAFAPYFTTDMRLMTGRYYKVTVNKGGWLVEDYIDFSQTQEVDWPTFPGGTEAMQAFIQKEMIYPAEAKNNKEQGNVVVLCRIDAQGNIVKSKVARSVSPSLDREALRIVSKMPRFVPRKNKYGKTFETPSWSVIIPFRL